MIHSKLILDIFDLTLDGYESADLLRSQLPFLTEAKFDHTGIGLYVHFSHDDEAFNYRALSELYDTTKNEGVIERLTGVGIKNEDLKILAYADIVLKDGIVNYLEIWNCNGEDYPLQEPARYELSQIWLDSPGRVIKR